MYLEAEREHLRQSWRIGEGIKMDLNRKEVPKTLFITAGFNTIIAIILSLLRFGSGFWINLLFSQCIGISICLCVMTVIHYLKPENFLIQFLWKVFALIFGTVVGSVVGLTALGIGPSALFDKQGFFIRMMLLGVVFGSIITYFFISRERISATETLVQQERIKRLNSEKIVAETHLRLLQAQIEPHFLFNTLSNILSLLDTDLGKGKAMLVDLIHYLRTTLDKSRDKSTTIGQELDIIGAYLNIHKIRMGDRLHYKIHLPDHLRGLSFPPMLVQPLVENAVKHGIEPSIKGGTVTIQVEGNESFIRLEIADSGVGSQDGMKWGFGLTNIKERLDSLFGDQGKLILKENRPCGLKVIIEVPYVKDEGADCR